MNNCACCCTNTLNLCKQDVCNGLNFGITTQIPGVHKLILYFLGVSITIEEEFIFGQEMVFPITDLNENFQYTGELYDPNGDRVLIRKNSIDYDCFKFRTTIGVTLNEVVIS